MLEVRRDYDDVVAEFCWIYTNIPRSHVDGVPAARLAAAWGGPCVTCTSQAGLPRMTSAVPMCEGCKIAAYLGGGAEHFLNYTAR
jgi:hypothetical protein